MASQLDNSLERFARPNLFSAANGAVFAALALIVAGLIVSMAEGSQLSAALFALAGLAVGAAVVLHVRSGRGGSAAGWIDWKAASPDVQRLNLNIAVGELSRALGENEGSTELRSTFIVAEDLALRQLQQEVNVPILRHLTVAGVPFASVHIQGNALVCGEVAFLASSELSQERVVAMMRKISAVKRSIAEMNIGLEVRLMVVLVTQISGDDLEVLRNTLSTKRFSSTPVDIDIRLMDFDSLQTKYFAP